MSISPIHVDSQPIDTFQGGSWRVQVVTAPGSLPVQRKADVVDIPYRAGDAILAGPDGLICGPISPVAALDLAERILEGDMRARTDSSPLLVLATALVAFMPIDDEPARAVLAPAVAAEAAPSADGATHG